MGLRLIRENSDTPNISNKDDARMVRYAYGGHDGFVKGRGSELGHSIDGAKFTMNSGIINLQGWEVEIDSDGWSMTVNSSDVTKRFFVVYCEVNLSLGGFAEIKSAYDTADFPTISTGDDLTTTTNGRARLPLYRFTAQSGIISNVEKTIQEIPYNSDEIALINQRLEEMGFKEASVENGAISPQDGWADAETSEVTIIKMAKFAILKRLYLETNSNLKAGGEGTITSGGTLGTGLIWGYISDISGVLTVIPEGLRPKTNLSVYGEAFVYANDAIDSFRRVIPIEINIATNGEVTARRTDCYIRNTNLLSASKNRPAAIFCKDVGWEIE